MQYYLIIIVIVIILYCYRVIIIITAMLLRDYRNYYKSFVSFSFLLQFSQASRNKYCDIEILWYRS